MKILQTAILLMEAPISAKKSALLNILPIEAIKRVSPFLYQGPKEKLKKVQRLVLDSKIYLKTILF
ncbi:hypothetical protein M3O96_14890 [Aquiflexum sp. TKW24L]|uniref:hypothetical protein n=1 Tax=Aquiflexum sp. TKW24L TaxID=2942212 RepID=UPI0020BF7DE7|nr:hypothetical protein [Aquiflexum sp. TKW24L]MCL6260386.1 hypothetical protein [Aquiflexum sp. TKW24L]